MIVCLLLVHLGMALLVLIEFGVNKKTKAKNPMELKILPLAVNGRSRSPTCF